MLQLAASLISISVKNVSNIWLDSLTGVLCAGYIKELISSYISRKKQGSVAFFDLDNFKTLNDTHGHYTGDQLLVDFCNTIKRKVRKGDFLGRLGGDEFILFMPKTDALEASCVVDRIQRYFKSSMTFSCGVTGIRSEDSFEDVYKRADEALYLAKANGKNRFEVIV